MSEFLDELARSLASPMSRRRAFRVAGVALAGAMLPGRAFAARPTASGCPDPGDLFCTNCPSVNGLFYGDVCCPGPDAAKYWECACTPGPGGGNGCKRKPCETCGYGCCVTDSEKCCHASAARGGDHCCAKDHACCGSGCCPTGTHCCANLRSKYEVGFRCCPDGWACCQNACCAPGTHCVNAQGKPASGIQGVMCSGGKSRMKNGTSPLHH
ncbi:MAG: hypothetical protein ABUS54_09140 [Actinomycetota bacterium]